MVFAAYARYYDLLYRDKDYAGEAAYVERLIRGANPQAASILELGCGTGLHASILAASGFRVHGIDLSDGMLDLAAERKQALAPEIANRLSYAQGDVRDYRIEQTFDAVTSLFHVASYQTANGDFEKLVETASRHLNPGGVFVFDFWYGPAVLTDPPVVRVKRLENDAIRVVRIAEPVQHPNENRVDVGYQIRITDKATGQSEEIEETHHMRYLFLPEVGEVLARQGFSSWRAEEWMTGRPPGFDTWGVCVIARK